MKPSRMFQRKWCNIEGNKISMKWGYVQKDASVRSVYRINICDANEAFMFVRSTNPVQLCASDVAISSDNPPYNPPVSFLLEKSEI